MGIKGSREKRTQIQTIKEEAEQLINQLKMLETEYVLKYRNEFADHTANEDLLLINVTRLRIGKKRQKSKDFESDQ
jgi:hypothetical protein